MIAALKQRALHRSKIIHGQLTGLEKMITSEAYCIDILIQSLAIQKALASLNKLVLENHLKTHVLADLSSANPLRERTSIDELLQLYELSSNRGKQG